MTQVKNQPIQFARHSYRTTAKQLSPQRLTNMYAERNPSDVKGDNAYTLYNTQGLKVFLDFNLPVDLPTHNMMKVGESLFVIIGVTVYKVEANKTFVEIGTLTSSSSNKAQLSQNGVQLTIIDSVGNGYVADSASVALITDPNFLPTIDTEFIDGFTVFGGVDLGASGRRDGYLISEPDDSATIDNDFGSAESEPDKMLGVKRYNGQLWLFGEDTIEVHQNTGNQDFPFQRINGAILDKGCGATASIVQEESVLIWLGNDRIFYMAQGYGYKKIATDPISQEIAKLTRVDNAFSFVYVEDNHKFYTTTFPTDKITLSYDITEGLWHDRESIDDSLQSSRWRANCQEFFAGKNLVGDFQKGIIYELDTDSFMEDGNTMVSEIISKVISNNTKKFKVDRLELDFEVGVGDIVGEGVNPQVTLQISLDGGRTYGAEMWRSLGKQGEYRTRVEWRQLGVADVKGMTFKVKISDPIRRALMGAYIDYEEFAV